MQKDRTKTKEIDEFSTHVKTWVELSQAHGKTSNEAGQYYDEHILPRVEKAFVQKSKDLLEGKRYDALILTVGGSPEPQILSISAIAGKSTQIGLLYRKAARDSFNRICERMGWTHHDSNIRGCPIDGSDTIEIYKTIMDFYTKWGKPKKIALGITGGKKVMSSAAAMAGAILGADIYYVDTEAKNKLNKPVPCSEYLRLLDNPYTVFGDFEADKANQLFKRHDYAGAQGIFKELTEQVRDIQKRIIYEAYELLCEVYNAWDNFNFQYASKKLKDLLDLLTRFRGSTELNDFHKVKSRFEEQKKALDCLSSFVNNDKGTAGLPCSMSDRFHFAFTLYHNALRRSEQGKYDLACLLLYRLLEWLGQCRLDSEYKIDTDASTHNYSEAGGLCTPQKTDGQILDKYIEKSKEIAPPGSLPKITLPAESITLVNMYLLLHALGDGLVAGFDWTNFKNQIETRNKSIYIHGRRVVDKKSFKEFQGTVKHIFEKAQALVGINASDFTRRHKFMVL